MRITSTPIAFALAAITVAVVAPMAAADPESQAGHAPPSAASVDTNMYIDESVENDRTMYLAFPTDAGDEACTSRNIYLAAGWYHWHGDADFEAGSVTDDHRDIYLAAGWYHWKDCVGAISQGGYTYYHDTYLRQESTGGYAHLERTQLWTTSPGTFKVWFGSWLIQY